MAQHFADPWANPNDPVASAIDDLYEAEGYWSSEEYDEAREAYLNNDYQTLERLTLSEAPFPSYSILKNYIQELKNQGGNNNMPNVIFKRGSHANLTANVYDFDTKTAKSGLQDGTFYLTTDTNRLYIGNNNKLVELNKSITTVTKVSDLPTTGVEVGQFYYVSGTNNPTEGSDKADNTHKGNILAVYLGEAAGGWVQVNPDTNTDAGYDRLKTASFSNKTVSTATNQITYTLSLNSVHTGVNGAAAEKSITAVTANLVIDGNDLVSIVPSVSVGVGSVYDSSTTSVSVTTTGTGANTNQKVTIKAGNSNIDLSDSTTNNIVIKGKNTTYTFGSPAGTTYIESKADGASALTMTTFTAGNGLAISGTTANYIQYSHGTVTATTAATSTATASDGAKITVVSGVQKDSFGHVTAVDTKTITAKNTTYSPNNIYADNQGNLTFAIKPSDSAGALSFSSTAQSLYHTITVDGTATTVYNQNSLGSFYSASEIDRKIDGLGAMHYRGTVGTNGDKTTLPTSNVHVGDTYMVVTDEIGPNSDSRIGDLYIATGTTDTNGIITSNLKWELVPAGNDIDTQYEFQLSNNKIQQRVKGTAAWTDIATIAGGNKLTASTTGSTIIINHDSINNLPDTELGTNEALSATNRSFKVPKFIVDDYGHITTAGETTLTLPEDKNTTYSVTAGASVAQTAEAGSKSSIILLAGGSGSGQTSVAIAGDRVAIDVSKSESDIKISHKPLLTSGTADTAYGLSTSVTPTAGGKIKIPQVKVNAQGHVTEVGEQEITLPPDRDTKFKLNQTTATVASDTSTGVTTATMTINLSDTSNPATNKTSSNIIVSSSSLKLTAITSGFNADLVWGSF